MPKQRRILGRLLLWIGIGLVAMFVAVYVYATDPDRLRERTLAMLRAMPIEGLDVAQVTFSPRAGLEISDLIILSDEVRRGTADRPPLLRVPLVRIRCDLVELLVGRIRPREIELREPTLSIVCDPAGPTDQAMSARVEAGARQLGRLLSAAGSLPRVTIDRADLQVLVMDHGQPRLVRRTLLRGVGRATASGYEVRIDREPIGNDPLAELEWNQRTGELTATLDWVDLETIGRVMPTRMANVFERLDLRGRARLERLVVRPVAREATSAPPGATRETSGPLLAAELRLADLRCVVPLEEEEPRPAGSAGRRPSSDHFLRLTGAGATLTCGHGGSEALTVELAGRLNGAPTQLNLQMDPGLLDRLTGAGANGAAGVSPVFGLDDIVSGELRITGIELPTAESHPRFVCSERLPGAVVSAFRKYQPGGRVNLHLRIVPPETLGTGGTVLAGAQRVVADLEVVGGSGRYVGFPYDFTDAQGHLRFAEGRIRLDELGARHGAGRVVANGLVNNSRSWTGFELTFRGRNVALDGDLYAALPDEYGEVWRRAAPLGVCDIVTTLRRAEGSTETGSASTDVRVEAHLLAGSLAFDGERRLNQADGRFTIHGPAVEIHDLHGYDGDSAVRLSGRIGVADEATTTDLHVEIADLPIEHVAVLEADAPQRPEEIRFSGRVDLWGRVHGSGLDGERTDHLAVDIKDGQLVGLDPTRVWTDCRGSVVVQGDQQRLVSFACQQGAARIQATGMLPSASASGQTQTLELEVDAPALEDVLPQFLPSRWARVAEALGLTGAGSVSARLYHGGEEHATGIHAADIEVRAARMEASPLPLELRDVDAKLTLSAGAFELRRTTAAWGAAGQISARGTGTWHGGVSNARFEVFAERLTFCPELFAALPAGMARLLERLAPTGEFDALLSRVGVEGQTEWTWQFEGLLPLRNAALRLGLDLTEADGELFGKCRITPDGEVDLEGKFFIQQARLAGRPIERWEGRLARQPGDRWVRLEDLRGRLCDGEVLGFLRVDLETSEYELEVTLQDVDAAQLLPPPAEQPERRRRGRVDGKVYLRGRAEEPLSRHGGGTLRVRGGSFLRTPVLASVAESGPGDQRAIDDTVDHADLRFLWEGEEIRFQRVEIHSRDLRLAGEGTWHLGSDAIEMTLVGAHPEHWPRVALLSKLLESAGQELVQYRVTGTLSSPKVTAEPLYKLTASLRRLLGEE